MGNKIANVANNDPIMRKTKTSVPFYGNIHALNKYIMPNKLCEKIHSHTPLDTACMILLHLRLIR